MDQLLEIAERVIEAAAVVVFVVLVFLMGALELFDEDDNYYRRL